MKKSSATDSDMIPGNFYYLFGFRPVRSKMELFWIIVAHTSCWLIFFSLPAIFFRIEIPDNSFFYREVINKLVLIGFFYLNYFYFIPKFFLKKKITRYCTAVLVSLVVLFIQQYFVEKIFIERFRRNAIFITNRFGTPPPTFGQAGVRTVFLGDSLRGARRLFTAKDEGPRLFRRSNFFFILPNVLSPWLLLLLIGGVIHLIAVLQKNKDEKKSLEMANLKAEVNLLKSQVNPHFLFNTLNSIYSQVYNQSKNAAGSVLMLSEIFRYVIYDTTAEFAPLEKDLHYISNYISLQRLRLVQKVKIDFKVEGDANGLLIAPLLLITFIENAFKHGISYTHPSTVVVHFSIFNKTITMLVSNPTISDITFDGAGVGLKNARRRLDLLYPGDYTLDITNDQGEFVVNLKINLDRD